MNDHSIEVSRGKRFAFGANWRRFLNVLDETRIAEATRELSQMLETGDLSGQTFLDIGCGSGLSSLAARRLGARVHAFDYDPEAVACAQELKRRYSPGDSDWIIEKGSALDTDYLQSLGRFDIVYSWGVLHHTGAMWQALENVAAAVKPGGRLFIAIYNDQGKWSELWRRIKQTYNRLPGWLRPLFAAGVLVPREAKSALFALFTFRPMRYVRTWTQYARRRGMSRWHDLIDWVGGYPFEFAKPDEIFDFYRAHGFSLSRLKTVRNASGCNQFVFRYDA